MANAAKSGEDPRPSLLLLELNEVNEELLASAARELGLANLQHILGLARTETFTKDTYESNYLEPWVQWVSIHTGLPSSCHPHAIA